MANLFTKKYLKVPHVHSSSFFKEIGRNAYVDWLIILILNTLVAITLVAAGIYLYWQISTGNFVSSETNIKVENNTFNKKLLESTINKFLVKEENTRQVKAGYRGPSDPGL